MRTEQVIRAECYGDCGGYVPSSYGGNTCITSEGQTIPIRYDLHSDATACISDGAVEFSPEAKYTF